jgi:hypothetical protein
MNPWQRWKKVSINNRLMIYMTAILAVATTLYTLMYRSQVKFTEQNARQTAEQTDRLIAASEKVAASTRDVLEEAKRANKESADRAERATKAGETQANASMSQANVSERMVKQNERAVNAAQTQADASLIQAKTSQALVRAAEAAASATQRSVEIATIAESPYVVTTKAYVSKKIIDERNTGGAMVFVEVENSGRTPAVARIYISSQIRDGREGILTLGGARELPHSSEFSRRYVLTANHPLAISTGIVPLRPELPRMLVLNPYVYVWGKIVYTDIFAKEVTFVFCYETGIGGNSLEMIPCKYVAPASK